MEHFMLLIFVCGVDSIGIYSLKKIYIYTERLKPSLIWKTKLFFEIFELSLQQSL